MCVCVCVCVCVCARTWVCLCVCVCEKERFGVHGIHVCSVHDSVCLALYTIVI